MTANNLYNFINTMETTFSISMESSGNFPSLFFFNTTDGKAAEDVSVSSLSTLLEVEREVGCCGSVTRFRYFQIFNNNLFGALSFAFYGTVAYVANCTGY